MQKKQSISQLLRDSTPRDTDLSILIDTPEIRVLRKNPSGRQPLSERPPTPYEKEDEEPRRASHDAQGRHASEEEEEEEQEHKVINNIDLDDVDNNKVFLFVGDSNPTASELKTLSLYSPILVYSSDLFTNRDIRALKERGIKSVWVANRTRDANQWIQKNARLFRDELVLLACYTKRKTQRWLKEIEPDVVIKRSNIKKLAVLSVSELLEALSSQGHLSLAPNWFERCAPWIYSRHLEPKPKN